MKKIFAWLSGGVIKEIGNAIDKLTTTEEEKLIIKKQVQQILEEADNNAQVQVTERWKSDMNSDSFLSKNIAFGYTSACWITSSGISSSGHRHAPIPFNLK